MYRKRQTYVQSSASVSIVDDGRQLPLIILMPVTLLIALVTHGLRNEMGFPVNWL